MTASQVIHLTHNPDIQTNHTILNPPLKNQKNPRKQEAQNKKFTFKTTTGIKNNNWLDHPTRTLIQLSRVGLLVRQFVSELPILLSDFRSYQTPVHRTSLYGGTLMNKYRCQLPISPALNGKMMERCRRRIPGTSSNNSPKLKMNNGLLPCFISPQNTDIPNANQINNLEIFEYICSGHVNRNEYKVYLILASFCYE